MDKKVKKNLSAALAATLATGIGASAIPVKAETKTASVDELYKAAYDATMKVVETAKANSVKAYFAEKDGGASSTEVVVKAVEAGMQKDITAARAAIAALPADMVVAIGEFSKIVDNYQHPVFERIVTEINRLGEKDAKVSQVEINGIKTLVLETPDFKDNNGNDAKASYSTALDAVQLSYMTKVKEAVEKAEKSQAKEDLAAAKALVEDLAKATNNEGVTKFAKDLADKLVAAEKVAIESATATSKTTVVVKLNKAVDSVEAANFTIEGGNVTAAKLGDDKMTVTLSVSGLEYGKDYTVAAKDVLVNGEKKDFGSKAFTAPAVTDLWDLTVTATETELMADGADNTLVTFKLINKVTGEVDTNADNIVLDLNATYGTLSNKRVTIQDGQATVLLTSEFSNSNITTKIDAQIIEASGDYKELIGKVVGTAQVSFTTSTVDNVNTITLVSSESNQADRVTLFFDKEVSLKHFVDINARGELLYTIDGAGEYTANEVKAITSDASRIAHKLNDNAVIITQNGEVKTVKGLRPVIGNTKAMEVILDKAAILTDNQKVSVEVNTENSLGKVTNSKSGFTLTDARSPEVTSVTAQGLNILKVKFSEAMSDATFQIDGRFVKDTHFAVSFGEFNAITLADNRDLATIKLTAGYDEDGAGTKALPGYFTSGSHALQVSSAKDFAALTDVKNISTTQNLTFEIAEDSTKPTATVTVESPEQFRVKFDKLVLEDADALKAALTLQYFDAKTNTYKDVDDNKFAGFNKANDIVVSKVAGTGEFVVELVKDWTDLYNTSDSAKNYYNDKFRLVVDKDGVTNVANGFKNDKVELNLNYAGSPLNTPDVTSASISSIDRISGTDIFNVTMSEPVKLAGKDNAGPALAQGQTRLPDTTVQFIGTDKDGNKVTFDGEVLDYTDENGADMMFAVNWKTIGGKTPQDIVNAGGSTNWTLVVRSLSDDVGNTVASATKDFTIAKSATSATPFKVKKVAEKFLVDGTLADATKDVVTIVFTEGVQYKGGTSDATNPTQYTINGKTLPAGTSIKVDDSDNDATNGFDTVIITLPDGTLSVGADKSNVISVNKNLVSYDGTVLTGDTEIVITVAENVAAAKALADAKAAVIAATQADTDAKAAAAAAATALATATQADTDAKAAAAAAATALATATQADTDAKAAATAAANALAADTSNQTLIDADAAAKAAAAKAAADLVKAQDADTAAKAAATKAAADLVKAQDADTAAKAAATKAAADLAAAKAALEALQP